MVNISLNTVLRQFILAGIFVVPFIVFIVADNMFFPFITGKNFIFRIIIGLIFGAWVVLAIRDTRYRLKRSWLMLAVSVFIGVIGLATIFGEDISKSFWSNYERMDGYVTQIHLFAYFLVTGAVLNTERLWKYYLHTLIGVSVGMAFMALGQVISADDARSIRVDAQLGNAAYLASYMLFHITLVAYYLFKHVGSNLVKYMYGGIIVFQLFILYSTQTRGAILGLIGGAMLVTLLIIVFERKNKSARNIAIGIFASVMLLAGSFFFEPVQQSNFVQGQDTLRRLASISLTEHTTESRFLIWNMSMQGFKENPVLGWGQGNFTHVFNKYYTPEMYRNEPWFDRAHNIVFDWMIAGGILGLLSYLGIFVAALVLIWRRNDNDYSTISKAMFTGLLAAYFFQNIFVFDNLISYILFFTILSYVHFRGYKAHESHKHFDVILSKIKNKFKLRDTRVSEINDIAIPIAGFVLTMFIVFSLNYKPMATNLTLMEALRQGLPHQQEQALETFQKALAYESFGTTEVRERLIIHASRVVSMQIDDELKLDFATLALKEMDEQIEEIPQDAKYPLLSASLLNRMGQLGRAHEFLLKAQEISPHKEIILFELGVSYINSNQYEEGFEILKSAFDAAPQNSRGAQLYALSIIFSNKDERLTDIYEHGYDETILLHRMFVNAYTARGEMDKVIEIWKSLVEGNPTNVQYYGSLASVYASQGQVNEAVATLENIKRLDANLTDQINFYIDELLEEKN